MSDLRGRFIVSAPTCSLTRTWCTVRNGSVDVAFQATTQVPTEINYISGEYIDEEDAPTSLQLPEFYGRSQPGHNGPAPDIEPAVDTNEKDPEIIEVDASEHANDLQHSAWPPHAMIQWTPDGPTEDTPAPVLPSFNLHDTIYAGDKVCPDCKEPFSSPRKMRRHWETKHLGVKHDCPVCGKAVPGPIDRLTSHMKTCHPKEFDRMYRAQGAGSGSSGGSGSGSGSGSGNKRRRVRGLEGREGE